MCVFARVAYSDHRSNFGLHFLLSRELEARACTFAQHDGVDLLETRDEDVVNMGRQVHLDTQICLQILSDLIQLDV